MHTIINQNLCWLVVLTILKNISQWEGLSHILNMENKKCLKPPTSYNTYTHYIFSYKWGIKITLTISIINHYYKWKCTYNKYLLVVSTLLKNMKVSWDDSSQLNGKTKCFKPRTR